MRARLLCAAVLVIACGSFGVFAGSSSGKATTAASPVKVGLIAAESGAQATGGLDMIHGAKTAAALLNAKGGPNGSKINLVIADSPTTSAQEVQAIRNVISRGANLVVGGATTAACQGETPLLEQLNVVLSAISCATDTFTGPDVNARFFRPSTTTGLLTKAYVKALCAAKGVTRIDMIGIDLTSVKAGIPALKAGLANCNKRVGNIIMVPFSATDVLPYVTQLVKGLPANSKKSVIVHDVMFGALGAQFLKVAQQIGLYGKISQLGVFTTTWATDLQAVYPKVPKTLWVGEYSTDAWNTPLDKAWVKAYKKAYKTDPSGDSFNGARSMFGLAAAIAKAKSTDPAKVAKAYEGLKWQTPQGTESMNPVTHQGAPGYVQCSYESTKKTCSVVTKPH
jgi:branched-chain amino acid transport system substrate-binding protein